MEKSPNPCFADEKQPEKNPFSEFFTAWGIEPKQIKAVCPTDMDKQLRYRKGYVVLTDEGLYIFSSPRLTKRLNMTDKKPTPPEKDSEKEFYPLSDITSLSVESQVACVSLVAEMDGQQHLLAVTSESRAAELRRLARFVTKMDEGHSAPPTGHGPPMGRGGPMGMGRPHFVAAAGKGAGFKSRLGQFSRLMGFFKPYSIKVVAVVFCFLATALVGLVTPYLNGRCRTFSA